MAVTSALGSAAPISLGDAVDGRAGVQRRDLDQRHLAGLPQDPLDGAQVDDQQAVVLRAGLAEHAGHGEAPAADAHVVAHREAERPAAAAPAMSSWSSVGGRPAPTDHQRLSLNCCCRLHAEQQGAAALDLHRPDQLRRDTEMSRAAGDGVDPREVGLRDRPLAHGDAAGGDAAVAQGHVLGASA